MAQPRVRSVLVLAALWLLAVPLPAGAEPSYVGVAKCKSCHKKELMGNQHEAWEKGVHAKTLATLQSDKARQFALEKGLAVPPHEAPECLECHVTAFGVDASRINKSFDPTLGVQCESCHGPGSDYRKKKVMADHAKSVAKGMWEPDKDAAVCTACHNERSPSWDPAVGFDFEASKKHIAHPIPAEVKGRYLEIIAERRAAGEAGDEEEED